VSIDGPHLIYRNDYFGAAQHPVLAHWVAPFDVLSRRGRIGSMMMAWLLAVVGGAVCGGGV